MSDFNNAVSHLAERRMGRRAKLTSDRPFSWHWALEPIGAGRWTTGHAWTQAGARRAIRRALRRESQHRVVELAVEAPVVRRAA